MKHDKGKADISLIPPEVLLEIAEVLQFGADKYGRDNHRVDGHKTKWSRTYASIQRHLNDFWSGKDLDSESGKKHLAHAITQCVILLTQINDGHTNMDDRFPSRNNVKTSQDMLNGVIPSSQPQVYGKEEDVRGYARFKGDVNE